jgi:hypothetical protein
VSDDQQPPPKGSAARRARRIGGRPAPVPGTRPAPEGPRPRPADAPVTTSVSPPVRLDKTDRPTAAPAAGPVRSLPLAWFPAAVLGIAALLLLGILVWFSHGGYWDKPGGSSSSQPSTTDQERVLAAAKKCFATLNTYDYRKLDDAQAAGLACTTGSFTSDYEAAFQAQIQKYAPAAHAVQTAQVNKAGISQVSPTGEQWVVLIYGQLQTSNVSTEKSGSPRVSPVGGVLTMDCVGGSGTDCAGGKWLVGKVDVDTGTGLGG